MNDLHNDPASVTGRAWAPLAIGGRTYKVYPLTFDDLGELQAWVNSQIPDPFDAVTASPGFARLTVEAQKFAIRCAVELAAKGKRRLNSPEAADLINSPEGITQLLFLMIRRGNPSFTESNAATLVRQVTPEQVMKLHETAYGVESSVAAGDQLNEEAAGGSSDPKGPASRPTGGGPSTA